MVIRFNIGKKIVDFLKWKRSCVRNWRALNEILLKVDKLFYKLREIFLKFHEIFLKIDWNSCKRGNSLKNCVKFSEKLSEIFLKLCEILLKIV